MTAGLAPEEVRAIDTARDAELEQAAPGRVTPLREGLFDALSPGQTQQLGRVFTQVIDGSRGGVERPYEAGRIPTLSD